MSLTSKLKPPTVYICGQEALLSNTLDDARQHSILWKGQVNNLFWDDGSTTKKCYHRLQRSGEPAQLTQLKIYPESQEHFDDILISILVLEGKRTTLAVKDEAMLAISSIRKPMGAIYTPSLSRDIRSAVTDVGRLSRQRRCRYTDVPPSGEGDDYNNQLHSL